VYTGGKYVEKFINYIDTYIQHSITLADLISLSVDRTRYLFGEQMGIPSFGTESGYLLKNKGPSRFLNS